MTPVRTTFSLPLLLLRYEKNSLDKDVLADIQFAGDDKSTFKARMKKIFRPVSYPKDEWENGAYKKKDNS